MHNRKYLLLVTLLLSCAVSMAQDIEVRNMKMVEASSEASARKDINGTTCALLRVQMKEEGAIFEGNIIGEVSFKNGEYWIYMPNGSKRLGIKHPDFLPITVIFSEFGIKKMESGSEYLMSTKTHKEKPKKESSKRGMVVFQLTPSSSKLIVDNAPVTAAPGGQYSMSLPYGTHYYTVQYGDFSISHQAVKIDKEPKAVNVDLTEFFAKLTVTCKEKDATIIINDELSGIESVEKMVSPGQYVIKVQKEGFHPLSQTVSLDDNEDFKVSFGAMTAITGSVKVDYEPIGAEIFLDGTMVGVTPMEVKDVAAGEHQLEIKKDHALPLNRKIIVSEGKQLTIKGTLPMSTLGILLNEAEKGDGDAMYYLACYSEPLKDHVCSWWDGLSKYEKKSRNTKYPQSMDNTLLDVAGNLLHSPLNSYQWLIKALDAGETKEWMMSALSLYYQIKGQYKESFKWAEKCYNLPRKSNIPIIRLAWHYYHGHGINKDLDKAKELLEQLKYVGDYTYENIIQDIVQNEQYLCIIFCSPLHPYY